MQRITYNAAGSLRSMKVGQVVLLHPLTKEATIRNACSRLKKDGVGEWSCEKKFVEGTDKVKGYQVTRTA
jgi:hypothetical protein